MARQSWVQKQRPDGKWDLVPKDELGAWMNKHYPDRHSARSIEVIKDIEPFQNIAVDGKVIGGRKQKRDMMRAYNLVEVGNEMPTMHPRDIADSRRASPDKSIVESLKRHSQGKWL